MGALDGVNNRSVEDAVRTRSRLESWWVLAASL